MKGRIITAFTGMAMAFGAVGGMDRGTLGVVQGLVISGIGGVLLWVSTKDWK